MKNLLAKLKLKIKLFLSEFKNRWTSETPIWFRTIRRLSIKLVGTATALLGASMYVPNFSLPPIIQSACTYIIVAGVTAGVISNTAKSDKPNN